MHPLTNLSDRALKVLVILLLAAQPLSLKAIKAEYKKPMGWQSLNEALYELTHEGLISRLDFRGEAYVALPHARQMILGEGQILQTSPAEVLNLSRRGLEHLDSSSSRGEEEPDAESPLLLDGQTSPAEVSDADLYDPAHVLAEYGIQEPQRSKLAALRWITADFIDAHCSRVLAESKEMGYAIHRMREKWGAGKPSEAHLSTGGQRRAARKYLDYLK